MKTMENKEIESPIKLDFYEDCAVGVDLESMRIAYSKQKMIEKVISEFGIDFESAIEYLETTHWYLYLGKNTPIFLDDYDTIYQ